MSPFEAVTATRSATTEIRFQTIEVFRVQAAATALVCPPPGEVLDAAVRGEIAKQPRENGEPAPTKAAIDAAVELITKRPYEVRMPDVSVFFGEVQLTWRQGQKELTLLSEDGTAPKLHYYEWRNDARSDSKMVNPATSDDLIAALDWLK